MHIFGCMIAKSAKRNTGGPPSFKIGMLTYCFTLFLYKLASDYNARQVCKSVIAAGPSAAHFYQASDDDYSSHLILCLADWCHIVWLQNIMFGIDLLFLYHLLGSCRPASEWQDLANVIEDKGSTGIKVEPREMADSWHFINFMDLICICRLYTCKCYRFNYNTWYPMAVCKSHRMMRKLPRWGIGAVLPWVPLAPSLQERARKHFSEMILDVLAYCFACCPVNFRALPLKSLNMFFRLAA